MDHLRAPLGRIDIASASLMEEFGARLAACAGAGAVIGLSGELGVGKSTLARGLVTAALAATGNPPEEIPSPTFTLVQHYPFPSKDDPNRALWHMDLWRLESPDEIRELGLEEALGRHAAVIEWPERITPLLPDHTLLVDIAFHPDDPERRSVNLSTGEAAASGWSERLGGMPG